jgi:DNA-binding MarR family transcriptional regulator
MNRAEKLSFIFETGKRFRFYMHDQVLASGKGAPSICEDLSAIQLKTAMQVSLYQPMNLNELAKRLGVSAPSASVMVDRLVEKQVLTREADPQDRRRVQLRVHPKAEEDMKVMHQRFFEGFDHIARQMGNDTIDHWYAVMEQLDILLKEESA